MSNWKFTDETGRVVVRETGEGRLESMLADELPEGSVVDPYAAPPAVVPKRVSMRQARRALHQVGLLDMVGDLIDNLDEPERTAARIDWDYAQEVERQFGLVLQLAPALGLDEAELDDLFRLAGSFA